MLWAASRMDSPAPGRTILGPAKLPKALRSQPRESETERPGGLGAYYFGGSSIVCQRASDPPGCLDTNPARCPMPAALAPAAIKRRQTRYKLRMRRPMPASLCHPIKPCPLPKRLDPSLGDVLIVLLAQVLIVLGGHIAHSLC